jgi:ligand-binding sensor domain-containing protein
MSIPYFNTLHMRYCLLLPALIFCLFYHTGVHAQGQAIGAWRSHLPYNKVICVASDGNKLFAAGKSAFFTYDNLKDDLGTYSKVNGMSDVELAYVGHDPLSGTTVLAYTNSNIDLFKDETFYNIPYLKLRTISGDKSIYNIFIEDELAYLSTGIGILVVNLTRKEIKETYAFTKDKSAFAVRGMTSDKNYFFAVTANGLYRTLKSNPNIQASSSWKLLDSSRKYINATQSLGKVYVATQDSVFIINSDTTAFVFSSDSSTIRHIDPLANGLCVAVLHTKSNFGEIYSLNGLHQPVDSFETANPMQTVQTSDNHIWVADMTWGLRSLPKTVIPNGPYDIGAYDILPQDGELYVAHGSYDDRWNIGINYSGISILDDDKWKSYNTNNFEPFRNLKDAIRLAKDPKDNTLYIASQTDGLFYLKEDGTGGNYREDVFEMHNIDPSTYRLSGVAFDQDKNLWVTQSNSPHELMARSASDGNWYKFSLPPYLRPNFDNVAAGLIIDDYNQQWFFSAAGGGVLVYNTNGTFENTSDDTYVRLLSGQGNGNLPDNFVQCIVNDKKGTIWVGTANGIGIINCPDRITDGTCEAEIRVVQYDQFAGQLFLGENVKTIAVDGANRKWIGTGNGVWLISEDANKIISRFTVDNSPLPSNNIQTIKVDPVSGDVYFGTDKGLVSYKGTATDGGTANKDVVIFPNPVKREYSGPIAIKGLVDNADVRITDISGQLIYRTKANGGQATWNGTDYTGRRPQSGVFLVFATNSTGTETFAGKMVFIK